MSKVPHLIAVGLLAAGFSVNGWAAEEDQRSDIWLESKLATTYLLNDYLSPFTLDVEVDEGVAFLSGTVDSDVARDLAIEIAKGTDGIKEVKDNIDVKPREDRGESDAQASRDSDGQRTDADRNEFFRTVQDATITAAVKSKLLWDNNTEGLDIKVDTDDGVVTLKGDVASEANKDLAEQIARNTHGVQKVDNRLEVKHAR